MFSHRKLFLLLLLASSVGAQTYRASIRGAVTDPNKAVIPGALLTLSSKETNEQRISITDATGEYAISSLAPGSYTLKVVARGFSTLSQDIELTTNQELRVDASLEVEGITDPICLFPLPAI